MKKQILTVLSAVCLLTSCELDVDALRDKANRTDVTFVTNTLDVTKTAGSRAALADNSLTDLYVFDYLDGEYQSMDWQKSTDADFGSPSLSMKYGTHDIIFVAHRVSGFSYSTDNKNFNITTAVKPTWAKRVSLTVDASTATQAVELTQRTWKLTLNILDAIPADAASVSVLVGERYSGLSWSGTDLAGCNSVTDATTADLSSVIGRSGVTVNTYGFAPSADEYTTSVTITFKSSSGTTLATYTKDIPLQADYVTTIKGNYFAADNGFTVTVADAYQHTKEVTL